MQILRTKCVYTIYISIVQVKGSSSSRFRGLTANSASASASALVTRASVLALVYFIIGYTCRTLHSIYREVSRKNK